MKKLFFCICAAMFAFGIYIGLGGDTNLFNVMTGINPVSAEFEPVLLALLAKFGTVCLHMSVIGVISSILLHGEDRFRASDLWLIALIAANAVVMFYGIQAATTLHSGMAWDGTQYYAMWHALKHGALPVDPELGTITPVFPYAQRVLVPWLASLLPFSAEHAFRIINAVAIVLACGMLYWAWVGLAKFGKSLALGAILFFLLHWVGPARSLSACVYSADAPVYLFGALIMAAIFANRLWWLPVLAVPSVLCKEHFVYMFLALWMLATYRRVCNRERVNTMPIGAALIAAAAANMLARVWPFESAGLGGFTAMFFGWKRLCDPLSFVRLAVAAFTAYGVFLFAPLVFPLWQKTKNSMVFVFSALTLVFAVLGATDMMRTLFMGFPFVATFIMIGICESRSKSGLILAALCSVPVMRLVTSIPDPAQPLPLATGDVSGLYSWMPEYAAYGIVAAWAAYFILAGWLLMRVYAARREQS